MQSNQIKTGLGLTEPDNDEMDNIKNLVGDAGTFLTRAVQVSDSSYSIVHPWDVSIRTKARLRELALWPEEAA